MFMCREGAVPQLRTEDLFLIYRREAPMVSGPVSQNAAQKTFRRDRPAPDQRRPCAGRWRRPDLATPTVLTGTRGTGKNTCAKSWRGCQRGAPADALRATGAMACRGLESGSFLDVWSWTPPPTRRGSGAGPCGMRRSTPGPCEEAGVTSSTRCISLHPRASTPC